MGDGRLQDQFRPVVAAALAAALLALAIAGATPPPASAASATIDGVPLNITTDDVGHIQASFDGEPFNRFDPPYAGLTLDRGILATHGVWGTVPFVASSPPALSGSGTAGDPLKITTQYSSSSAPCYGDYLITQIDSYVNGDTGFTTTYEIKNVGGCLPVAVTAFYVGADVRAAGDDIGVGNLTAGFPRELSGLTDPYQTGDGLVETANSLSSIDSPWDLYKEGDAAALEAEVASIGGDLDNKIESAAHDTAVAIEQTDRGASNPLPAGESFVFSNRWQFRHVPPPINGQKVVLRNAGGTVLVKAPGQSDFFNLTDPRRVPVGSLIDVRNGFVEVTAENASGIDETMTFWDGLFEVQQQGDPLTAKLAEQLSCKSRKKKKKKGKSASAAAGPLAHAASASRQLWAKGQGRFRTTGHKGSATVRGTEWLTTDRCSKGKQQTRFKLVSGQLEIDDFGKKGTVNKILGAGKTFTTGKKKKKGKKK